MSYRRIQEHGPVIARTVVHADGTQFMTIEFEIEGKLTPNGFMELLSKSMLKKKNEQTAVQRRY